MFNPQLINSLNDFFATFKEVVALATNPQNLDSVITGLADAKEVLVQHDVAKADLAELAAFKVSKAKQLADLADAQTAADAAAQLNTDQAKALSATADELAKKQADLDAANNDVAAKIAVVQAREDAVTASEKAVEDTKAAAEQALTDANTLKQSYIAKLQTLAQTEGGSNGGSST